MRVDILVGSFSAFLQVLHFDTAARTVELETVAQPDFANHTWITRHPSLPNLFYATQSPTTGGHGFVSVIKVAGGESGGASAYTLQILQTVSSGGIDPAHLGIKQNASELAVANVGLRSACIALTADGMSRQYGSSNVLVAQLDSNGTITSQKVLDFTNTDLPLGPNQERQEASHPHGCYYTEGGDLLVPDLGCDAVRLAGNQQSYKSSPGAGPRHLAINGKITYVVNELINTVTVHPLKNADAQPQDLKSYSILPKDCAAPEGQGMSAAEIMLSEDGRQLYVTNRDEGSPQGDAIAHFSVSDDGLSLTKQNDTRTGLDHLRGAELFEAGGKGYLITGSRTGKGAAVYLRDGKTGVLSEVARNKDVLQPSCFAPVC